MTIRHKDEEDSRESCADVEPAAFSPRGRMSYLSSVPELLGTPSAIIRIRNELRKEHDLRYWVDFTFALEQARTLPFQRSHGVSIRPMQIRQELSKFLELVSRKAASTLLEIGTARGGTLFLLARAAAPNALLLSIDLPPGPTTGGYPRWRELLYKSFAAKSQKVVLVRRDSHQAECRRAVDTLLGNRSVDVLFIDGDHSYEGVAADFRLYSPLVRKGGTIALHDIVSDFRSRHGLATPSDSGGVPLFWSRVKDDYASEEIVADHDQDGFGIGILRKEH